MSPYLKSLSMVAANKLLHLLEAFSTTWFLFSAAQNHHLVFFLLEVFNNIIQYQFDGEAMAKTPGLDRGGGGPGAGTRTGSGKGTFMSEGGSSEKLFPRKVTSWRSHRGHIPPAAHPALAACLGRVSAPRG